MKYFKRLFLVVIFSIPLIKSIDNNIKAAIPYKRNKAKVNESFFDYQRVMMIEDSLKAIDSRNSIIPEVSVSFKGEVFFIVLIYTNIQKKDQDNIFISEVEYHAAEWRKKNGVLVVPTI